MDFYLLGDMGSGYEEQFIVSNALSETINKSKKKQFVCGLGDNIYDKGCSSVNDKQFYDKFEKPYESIDDKIKFYMCLGNHDYGYEISNVLRRRNAQCQVDYSEFSKKWVMPHQYYSFNKNINGVKVEFFYIDSNLDALEKEDILKQLNIMSEKINNSKADWKIVIGHHTWRSVAGHGNAEDYFEDFLRRLFLSSGNENNGSFDMYICGHDHNKQHIKSMIDGKSINMIVCGTGGKLFDDDIRLDRINGTNSELKFFSNNLGYAGCAVKKLNNKKILTFTFFNEKNEKEYILELTKE